MIFVNSFTCFPVIVDTTPREYPPLPGLTTNPMNITTASYGNGNHVCTWSSQAGVGFEGWRVFDKSVNPTAPENVWVSDGSSSSSNYLTGGNYQGSATTNGIPGEWVDLVFPNAIVLTSYRIGNKNNSNNTDNITQSPNSFTIMGSNNNGTSWTNLNSQINITWASGGLVYSFDISNNSTAFNKYRLVISKNNSQGGGGAWMTIGEFRLFGF